MAKLIYLTNVSLDGFIEDVHGEFAWLPVDDEVFAFTTDLLKTMGTFLYGRRLYEAMSVWETDPSLAEHSDLFAEFAKTYVSGSKIVYSSSLSQVSTTRTRIEHHFDPDAIRDLKAQEDHDLLIGGANLAEQAFAAGVVDECQLFVLPVIVGGGKPGLPTGMLTNLELLEERRFGNGVLYVRYRVLG